MLLMELFPTDESSYLGVYDVAFNGVATDSEVVLKTLLLGMVFDSLMIRLPKGVDDTDRHLFITEITPSISISVNGRSPFSWKKDASFALDTLGSSSSASLSSAKVLSAV